MPAELQPRIDRTSSTSSATKIRHTARQRCVARLRQLSIRQRVVRGQKLFDMFSGGEIMARLNQSTFASRVQRAADTIYADILLRLRPSDGHRYGRCSWRTGTIISQRLWLVTVLSLTFLALATITSSVDGQKLSDEVARVNVSRELIARVAEQRRQHLQRADDERKLQQRGNGATDAVVVAPSHGINHKQKPKTKSGHTNPSGKKSGESHHLADSPKEPCQPLPPAILRQILGAAYNPRYMSIDKPHWADGSDPNSAERATGIKSGQRDQEWTGEPARKLESFHVHGGYTRILHEEPVVVLQDSSEEDGTEKAAGARTGGHRLSMNALDDDQGGEDIRDESKAFDTAESTNVQTERPAHHQHQHRRRKNHGHNNHRRHHNNAKNSTSTTPATKQKSTNRAAKNTQIDTEAHFKRMTFEQVEQVPADAVNEQTRPITSGSDKFLSLVRHRRTVKAGFPWSCDSRIEWIDLGPNHFPRFLRSVVCTSDRCWFGHFQCRPKAFTVKILRRRKDSCNPSVSGEDDDYSSDEAVLGQTAIMDETLIDINSRVPDEFREQWVFEERAVTFCCECAA